MKKINKDILKQLEKYDFSKEINSDPLRLAYYTALKGYKTHLPKINEYTRTTTLTEFNKYSKDLLKIMKTDAHVYHILAKDLEINKGLYYITYTAKTRKITYYYKWNETERNFNIYSKIDVLEYLYESVGSLFPALVFVNYKTSRLKEIFNLLQMNLEEYSDSVKDMYYRERKIWKQ